MNGEGRAGTLRQGAQAALPIVLGYLSIGFAAGVVQRASGLSVAEVMLMSLLLYAGSAQFVVAGLIAAASHAQLPVLAIVATVFLVNLRHVLLSAALAPHFTSVSAGRNALLGLQLTDETFVVAWTALVRGALPQRGRAAWMAGLNLSAYFSWAAANLAGALASGLVADARASGFDFALPAMFAALLVLQFTAPQSTSPEAAGQQAAQRARMRGMLVVALIAAALAVGIALLIPGQWNILLATLVAATLALVLDKAWTSARTS
ncbi:MAG: branched-chain amino acid ABC transporter permease [Betaproteobacteria bacterium]|nr:branched-chain amino acid ABC transporter permease [Betaproteobacteria bacterium]